MIDPVRLTHDLRNEHHFDQGVNPRVLPTGVHRWTLSASLQSDVCSDWRMVLDSHLGRTRRPNKRRRKLAADYYVGPDLLLQTNFGQLDFLHTSLRTLPHRHYKLSIIIGRYQYDSRPCYCLYAAIRNQQIAYGHQAKMGRWRHLYAGGIVSGL